MFIDSFECLRVFHNSTINNNLSEREEKMTETQAKLNDVPYTEYGETMEEIRKSICEFRKMMKSIIEKCDFERTKVHYLKVLKEDVQWMRDILILKEDGIKIVNKQLSAAYFEFDNLWYKTRYLEVSSGLHVYDDWVAEYIHDLLVDGKKLTRKEINLMKQGNNVLYQMCVNDGGIMEE